MIQPAPDVSSQSWLYNGRFPGPELRVPEGDILRVPITNDLPEGTTIHWHGVPVPNAMDGVPDVTQQPIQPDSTFTYTFQAEPAGTYFYR
jgi:FtsP/CotA-like multicopper oxidase with cupredoxin domain